MSGEQFIGIGVDLGTSNLQVYVEGSTTIFSEPTVVAMDRRNGNIIAVGERAYNMIGKTHSKVAILKPLREGVISDMAAVKVLLQQVLEKLQIAKDFSTTNLLLCCPSGLTETERDAIKKVGTELGAHSVIIEEEVKASLIGSGIDIYTPTGSIIIDIGGGTTDVGVVSLGDIVLSKSIRVAGNHFDRLIARMVKENHNLEVGERTSERIKIQLGTVEKEIENPKTMTVYGRNLVTGLPAEATISSEEVRGVLLTAFEEIKIIVASTLEETPPEICSDIVTNGVLLSGGGALIPGIIEYFEDFIHVPVSLSMEPLSSVALGTKILLTHDPFDYYSKKNY